ncbi:MAG: O-antigen ligase family protein [Planctomycetota bacterium]
MIGLTLMGLVGAAGWIALGIGRPVDAVIALAIYLGALAVIAARPMAAVPVLFGVLFFNREVRRLLDWIQGEYSALPPTSLLVPALAFSMGLFALRDWRKLPRKIRIAVTFIFAGLGYGLLVGVTLGGAKFAAIFAALTWFSPVMGFLFVARLRPSFACVKHWVLAAGVMTAIAGAYGWYQWVIFPPWSEFWVVNSGMGSIGQPEPLKVRFFGPFGAPGQMGMTCSVVAALLLMFRPLRAPILWPLGIFLGACAIASLVRSAWLTAGLCLIFFALFSRAGDKLRVTVTVVVVVLGLGLVLPMLPGGDKMIDRLGTLSDVSNDGSFQGRVQFSGYALQAIAGRPWGFGMGTTGSAMERMGVGSARVMAFDNGFLQIPYALGLPGALLFWIGIVKLGILLGMTQPVDDNHRRLIRIAAALAVGHVAALAVSNFFKTDAALFPYILFATALALPGRPSAGAPQVRSFPQ